MTFRTINHLFNTLSDVIWHVDSKENAALRAVNDVSNHETFIEVGYHFEHIMIAS
jgi:hypothetical protein